MIRSFCLCSALYSGSTVGLAKLEKNGGDRSILACRLHMAFDRAAEAPKNEAILAEMGRIELVVPLNMQPNGIITAGTQGCDEPYTASNSYEVPGCRPPLELFSKAVVTCERTVRDNSRFGMVTTREDKIW